MVAQGREYHAHQPGAHPSVKDRTVFGCYIATEKPGRDRRGEVSPARYLTLVILRPGVIMFGGLPAVLGRVHALQAVRALRTLEPVDIAQTMPPMYFPPIYSWL